VALIAPVPRPPRRLSAKRENRWMTLSRHPGSWPVLHLITWMKADRQTSFRSTRWLTLSCQMPRRLGPRSLEPPPFVRALRSSLFEARMLPADFCNCIRRTGARPELSFPRRDDGHDHLPFLNVSRTTPLARAVTRGEPRMRPYDPIPVPVPPACAGFPDRDTESPRHLPRLAPRRVE